MLERSRTPWLRNAVPVALLAWAGLAGAADPGLEKRLGACRGIEDKARRLECFDSVSSAPASPAAAVPGRPVPESTTPAAPAVEAASPPEPPPPVISVGFGSESVINPRSYKGPNSMSATAIGSFGDIVRGQTFALDNGQVWLAVDDRSYDYESKDPGVIIYRNFMGHYWMKLENGSFRVRVRRVK